MNKQCELSIWKCMDILYSHGEVTVIVQMCTELETVVFSNDIKKYKVETIQFGDYTNSYIFMQDMDIKRNHN
jgi:hypothetical protein